MIKEFTGACAHRRMRAFHVESKSLLHWTYNHCANGCVESRGRHLWPFVPCSFLFQIFAHPFALYISCHVANKGYEAYCPRRAVSSSSRSSRLISALSLDFDRCTTCGVAQQWFSNGTTVVPAANLRWHASSSVAVSFSAWSIEHQCH